MTISPVIISEPSVSRDDIVTVLTASPGHPSVNDPVLSPKRVVNNYITYRCGTLRAVCDVFSFVIIGTNFRLY